MNYDDIKNNVDYTKLVFDRLSELRREYQRTEKQSQLLTGREDILRQQLQEREREVCYKRS